MLSFDDMNQIYNNNISIGQELKEMSDTVMQETFDNDIQTKICYLYDYYHDDQPESLDGYDPSKSKYKVPVKAKFIIKEYKSAAKDDPEYHIMFEPDFWNNLNLETDDRFQWFKQYSKLGVKFPIGLYVDIPDDRRIYHKWLFFYDEPANQFPKFGVIRCNYKFQWIEDDGINRYKRNMWGTQRTQNSYTSGVWSGDKTTVYDDQDKFWLPWNPISSFLYHDMRLFISMPQKIPYVYQLSKIKNISPKGILTVTVKQTEFNQHVDYVNLETGEMYANYYSSDIKPEENSNFIDKDIDIVNKLVIEPESYNLRIGLGLNLNAKLYDINNSEIQIDNYENIYWKLTLNDIDVTENRDIITVFEKDKQSLRLKFLKDARFVGKLINVECKYNDIVATTQLSIIH